MARGPHVNHWPSTRQKDEAPSPRAQVRGDWCQPPVYTVLAILSKCVKGPTMASASGPVVFSFSSFSLSSPRGLTTNRQTDRRTNGGSTRHHRRMPEKEEPQFDVGGYTTDLGGGSRSISLSARNLMGRPFCRACLPILLRTWRPTLGANGLRGDHQFEGREHWCAQIHKILDRGAQCSRIYPL